MLDDPARRRRASDDAEPPALPAGQGGARGRQARRLREAAGARPRPSRRSCSRSPSRAGSSTARTSTSASTRWCQEARARVRAGELGDVVERPRRLPAGLAAADTDWNWRLEPDQGGALRAVGDIGSHWLDLVQFVTGLAGRGGLRRPDDVHPRPAAADGRGRDVRRRAATSSGSTSPMTTEDLAASSAALQRRRARLVRRLAGQRGPQERLALRGRRLAGRRWRGLASARGALARPPRRAERAAPQPGLMAAARPRDAPARPGTPRASPTRSRSSTARSTRAVAAGAAGRADYPTFARRPRRERARRGDRRCSRPLSNDGWR